MKRKLKLILFNIATSVDDKVITTVLVTLGIFAMLISFGNALSQIGHHKDPSNSFLISIVWFWMANHWLTAYNKRKLEREVDGVRQDMSQLVQLIMMIREANQHGVTIQELEKKGILRMEIMAIDKRTGQPTPPTTDEDMEIIDKIVEKKKQQAKKKEKLPN